MIRIPSRSRARSGALRRGGAVFSKWIGPAVTVLAFAGFTLFLVMRLQEGFERRAGEWFGAADEVPVEPEEVVSTEVEFTRFDEQGRLILEGRAEQALGRSDGQQRFLEVEVRLVGAFNDQDAVVAADELLLDPRTEAVEFIGIALLSVEGLELSGPHLHFRRSPDRLWSRDPVQFRSDDFVGIAASMQFEIASRDVSLQGVVALPAADEGFEVVAERVRFDGDTADTSLFGDVEIASDELTLFSEESVIARRDREQSRMRSIEAGFGTELTFLDPARERDVRVEETTEERLVLRGDELEISLEEGRIPRRIHVRENPLLRKGAGVELRGEAATFALDSGGTPENLAMTGEVRSRLPGGPDRQYLISVESTDLEVDFDPRGDVAEASFRGRVRARHGRASATADGARWDGVDTLVLEGSPRLVDSSLVELESGDLRLVIAEPTRVEAGAGVTARFLPARLDWLPGEFESVVLTGDSAVMAAGAGQGVFSGSVRLLFGRNRLLSDEVSVDAEGRTLDATGQVVTSLELEGPAADAEEAGREALPEVDGRRAEADPAAARTAVASAEDPAAGDATPASPFVFTAEAERFRYEANASRMSFEGDPRLERLGPEGEVSRIIAGRIEADLTTTGSLGMLRGVRGARFERGDNLVRGSRVHYEPGSDLLLAWGSPAVVQVEGRTSEGGLLELALADSRTRIHPTRVRRAITRARVGRGEALSPR